MRVNNNMNDQEANDSLSEEFEFPRVLLDQISECSPEGFLLFTINETGEVELYSKPAASIIEAGLRARALQIMHTMEKMDDSDIASQMFDQRNPEDPESGPDFLE